MNETAQEATAVTATLVEYEPQKLPACIGRGKTTIMHISLNL